MDKLKLFDLAMAAKYLGVKPETVKYHLYVSRRLKPSYRFPRKVLFTQATLDEFNKALAKAKQARRRRRIAKEQS